MIELVADIWNFHADGKWIVITTNIGWKKDGMNPMGAGIAKHAASMFPELPSWYGARCKKYGKDTAVCFYEPARFILFPTKPLNYYQPWLSWQSMSSIELINRSAIQLQKLGEIMYERNMTNEKIALPLVGCENGRLNRCDVIPILHKNLDDRFVLVERQLNLETM